MPYEVTFNKQPTLGTKKQFMELEVKGNLVPLRSGSNNESPSMSMMVAVVAVVSVVVAVMVAVVAVAVAVVSEV